MKPLQIELTKLIGKKELEFGCIIQDDRLSKIISKDYNTEGLKTGRYRMVDDGENLYTGIVKKEEIIGHPATLSDFHNFLNEKRITWSQIPEDMRVFKNQISGPYRDIKYYSSLPILEQENSTLEQIIDLIKSNP